MKRVIYFIVTGLCALPMIGKEYNGGGGIAPAPVQNSAEFGKILAPCGNTSTNTDLQINNVRARLFTKGDMWWDLNSTARYIVPKNSANLASSLFAGMIWFGGRDASKNLKVAAMTYRSQGARVDFWPGPLIPDGPLKGTTEKAICDSYDKFYNIKRRDVRDFRDFVDNLPPGTTNIDNLYDIPATILNWPGNYPAGTNNALAPFFDRNGNGIYEPKLGDYPNYDVDGGKDCRARGNRFMYGDETIFWVFNDMGNIKTSTALGGAGIGMEIRSQAFAYQTTDQLNDMTFYSHELVNKGNSVLDSTFFGVWTDADLGGANDDYIGCDASNGFGYLYNADNFDANQSGTSGYLDNLPAVGIDFFRGPFKDSPLVDLNGDGDTTDFNEANWDMQFFMYFNNTGQGSPVQYTDPTNGTEYYRYLTGRFRNNEQLVYGGNGTPKIGGDNIPTRYCYPGTTDPLNTGTNNGVPGPPPLGNNGSSILIPGGWSETNNGTTTPNAPDDRRFVQSAGPFKLLPGATNYITTGVPWAQSSIKGDNLAPLGLLTIADVKAQNLFDACFIKFEDIDPPSVKVTEVSNGFHAYLYNLPTSNNYALSYAKTDPAIPLPISAGDRKKYKFEGYIVYQLKSKDVSNNELSDPSKAKIVFLTNIKNGVTSLVNYEQKFDDIKKSFYYDAETKVLTTKEGLETNFFYENDLFATGTSPKLVNEKVYYYAAIAYSYNEYQKFNPLSPTSGPNPAPIGQNIVFRASSNATFFSIVPRRNFNTVGSNNVNYGTQRSFLPVTRSEGQGVGFATNLQFEIETENNIVANGAAINPTYKGGASPVIVRVIDPAVLTKSKYIIKLGVKKSRVGGIISLGDTSNTNPTTKQNIIDESTSWVLKNLTTGAEYSDISLINYGEEFYIPEEGISLSMKQSPAYFAAASANGNSTLPGIDDFSISISYADPLKAWLKGVPDNNTVLTAAGNWILSGSKISASGVIGNTNERENSDIYFDIVSGSRRYVDSTGIIQKNSITGWAPYCFTGHNYYGNGVITNPPIKGSQPAMDMLLAKIRHREITRGRWRYLANVDLVITNDKTKWSRCPVIELGNRVAETQGGVFRHKLRSATSVDKEGNEIVDPNFPTGMGWFPGYAINLSTGERLNIVFGEDSRLASGNGRDMVWNPTDTLTATGDTEERTEWGGKHYIYIFGHNGDTKFDNTFPSMNGKRADVDKYDEGKSIYDILSYNFPNPAKPDSSFAVYKEVWKDAMYVGMPILDSATYKSGAFVDLANPKKITIPTETRISFRVNEAFKTGYSGIYGNFPYSATSIGAEIPTNKGQYPTNKSSITDSDPLFNGNLSAFTFSTESIELPVKTTAADAKSYLDLINVVPNPYFSSSEYEVRSLDNIVKITNLPEKCDIKIYTMNGQLVREFFVNNAANKTEQGNQTFTVNWDLKNFNNIPIASGLYLIHINVPGVGEKVVKWFGTLRPTDLSNF